MTVMNRSSMNIIDTISYEEGETLTDAYQLEAIIVSFYKGLLSTCESSLKGVDVTMLKTGAQLSNVHAFSFVKKVSKIKIDNALQSIPDKKAQVPIGLNAYFYKQSWHIIKEEVYASILDFFSSYNLYFPVV